MLLPKVFISYSHSDEEFAKKLAEDLAARRIIVWWDGWALGVGDSLMEKVQKGISSSSYLAIVLSPASVQSSWVREELNAALVQQLNEKQIRVLPILLKDCEIPLFLQEKIYADFRSDHESGLAELVKAIKPPDIRSTGRAEAARYHNDYAFDWGTHEGLYGFGLEINSHSSELLYTVKCSMTLAANEIMSARCKSYEQAGFKWAASSMLLIQAEDIAKQTEPVILIEGDLEAKQKRVIRDQARGYEATLIIRARRLGTDPGEDVLYEWGSIVNFVADHHREGIRAGLPPGEEARFHEWRLENPP